MAEVLKSQSYQLFKGGTLFKKKYGRSVADYQKYGRFLLDYCSLDSFSANL